ncbi:MAG: hypothetical protein R3D26_12050 [Cyanobacteriota/Melainabacteria group bacterium]
MTHAFSWEGIDGSLRDSTFRFQSGHIRYLTTIVDLLSLPGDKESPDLVEVIETETGLLFELDPRMPKLKPISEPMLLKG